MMYHFTAVHRPEPVRLSHRSLIPGHIRQYIKSFQLSAIRFMHSFLSKSEFCIYNDESGLGKQAAVVVLLDAACNNQKCLIVVQNDDRYVTGWEFHFNILTSSRVIVIKDEKDSIDSSYSIYIAKWSVLRAIGDLSKLKFDNIIIDNRGQMLNNSFCTSMLLKHYERKVKILISSVDITSDLKLLHNVLRLGGRLDPQYSSFKVFEEKFKLPDAKELAYKRVDLEEYFCKRERLADYCRAFRLRRYCHQFETQLPLVQQDRYKINLDLWREKQNATNSESSSVEYVTFKNKKNEQIKDTQELFEEYCKQRRKEHFQFQQEEEKRMQEKNREMFRNLEAEIIYNVDDEVALINDSHPMVIETPHFVRDNSDEPQLMSPLRVESDSDNDDMPEMFNDPTAGIEIVELSSEETGNHTPHEKNNEVIDNIIPVADNSKSSINNKNALKKKSYKKRSELERLAEDIVDTLKIKDQSKRLSRNTTHKVNLRFNKRLKDTLKEEPVSVHTVNNTCINEKINKSVTNTRNSGVGNKKSLHQITSKNLKSSEIGENTNCTAIMATKILNDQNTSMLSEKGLTSNLDSAGRRKKAYKCNTKNNEANNIKSPLTAKKTSGKKFVNTSNKKQAPDNHVQIKDEILEETFQQKKIVLKDSPAKVNKEKIRSKRTIDILPAGVHHKQTRSMKRLTRSAVGGSKYLTKNLSLQIDKINKHRNTLVLKETPKAVKTNKYIDDENPKGSNENKNKNVIEDSVKSVNTQFSIISHRSSQDFESLQCAQRLSGADVFSIEKAPEFLVPSAPNSITKNSLIPSSLTSLAGYCTESDVFIMPSTNPKSAPPNRKSNQVILLSSSDNENSTSLSSSPSFSMTSRRTRALKPRRIQQEIVDKPSKLSKFSTLLAQENKCLYAKSPDLFSSSSDLIQLPCSQPNVTEETPNTPFEGFKIFGSEVKQLQQHFAINQNTNTIKQRSCLDILEKMFEPPNKKLIQTAHDKSSMSYKKPNGGLKSISKQKTHAQILPFHPIEAITESRHQQEQQNLKLSSVASSSELQDDEIFEITNNGTFGSVMCLHSNGDISPVQHTQKTNAKQHNKITNYLIGNTVQNGCQEETTPNSGNDAANINTEAGTPSKRRQQLISGQTNNMKKSPKSKCNLTQATKLTKWFTKPSELTSHENSAIVTSTNSKMTSTTQMHANQEINLNNTTSTSPQSTGDKRVLKRRRLELSFHK